MRNCPDCDYPPIRCICPGDEPPPPPNVGRWRAAMLRLKTRLREGGYDRAARHLEYDQPPVKRLDGSFRVYVRAVAGTLHAVDESGRLLADETHCYVEKPASKGGRPRKEGGASRTVQVRVRPTTLGILRNEAKRQRIPLGTLLRQLLEAHVEAGDAARPDDE